MPVKRRIGKRSNLEAEREVWEGIFDTGYDFFDELPQIGVEIGDDLKADPIAAALAWQRFGLDYLRSHGRAKGNGEPIWALQFGEPNG